MSILRLLGVNTSAALARTASSSPLSRFFQSPDNHDPHGEPERLMIDGLTIRLPAIMRADEY